MNINLTEYLDFFFTVPDNLFIGIYFNKLATRQLLLVALKHRRFQESRTTSQLLTLLSYLLNY